MPRVSPLERSQAPEFEPVFQAMEGALGYVPNSFFTMARVPGILAAVGALMDGLWYPDTVTEGMRRLVTFGYSRFAGSTYSAAHCAYGAEELGLPIEKILSIDGFETSTAYSEAERAVLRLCRHAARIPSEVTDSDVSELAQYFETNEIVFLTGLIATMAFLNKWNEIMDTTLEPKPSEWASQNLNAIGWPAGREF